jgi:hypothetical protein
MLLIISPSKFVPAIRRLKAHKEQTGIKAKIVTLEQIWEEYDNKGDLAERVKRYIFEAHQKSFDPKLSFALLVGDADTFPVRYTKIDRNDSNIFNIAFYPTDLYYAGLYKSDGNFDNWDANNNGYYGELNGSSHSGTINVDKVNMGPSVAVGRVPASTLTEVETYVSKVITYEWNAYDTRAQKAVLLATHNWIADACHIQERIAKNYLKKYICHVYSSTGSPCPSAGTLSAVGITNCFNNGVGLIGYIGHGQSDALQIPSGNWGVNDIPQLNNTDRLPIMAVAACSTAEFTTLPPYGPYIDIYGVQHNGANQGENFTVPPPQPSCLQTWVDPDNDLATQLTVRTKAGVVAYLGGVTGMQFYEPVEYFFQGIAKYETVGAAWQWMVRHYYDVQQLPESLSNPDWVTVARVHQPWKYMLFGDPSLRIGGVGPKLPLPKKPGVYTVQQKSNSRFLDAYESGNDFSVVTRSAQNNDSQKWSFTPLGGIYKIQQKSSRRYLDAYLDSNHDFSMVTRTAQNNTTQEWLILYLGNDRYTIQQQSNGRFADAHENSSNDYFAVTRTPQNNDTQRWILTPQSDDTYTIQQVSNSRFLDAYEEAGDDYSVVTREAQNNDSQRWTLRQVSGVYRIQQKINGRFLDAYEQAGDDYSVVTREAQNNDSQRWIVTDNHEAYTVHTYTIQQMSNSRYVDAHESAGNDYSVVTRPAQNNDSQRWLLTLQFDSM